MKTTKPTICLNMIVKNESAVITRCLDSVADFIDFWVISDTGSTDNTQTIITDYFKQHGIDGLLTDDKWVNFAHNRNIALNHARDKADYILFMDADDYLVKSPNFRFPALSAGDYLLKMRRGNIDYYNTKLIRTNLPWRWEGVLHEYLTCDIPHDRVNLEGDYLIESTTEGARGQNPAKYEQDAAILEAALETEPDNTRYRFYLAQSYRDSGNHAKALENYQKRATMGGWEEEVYCALLEAAHQQRFIGTDFLDCIRSYTDAYCYRPQRLEAIYHAVRLCREQGYYSLGYCLGWDARQTPYPEDILFVDKSVYQWQLLDELSICAAYSHKKTEAATTIRQLLESQDTPAEQHQRLQSNLAFALS